MKIRDIAYNESDTSCLWTWERMIEKTELFYKKEDTAFDFERLARKLDVIAFLEKRKKKEKKMVDELKKIWEEHQVEIILLAVTTAIFVSGYAMGYRYGVLRWSRHLSIKWFINPETSTVDRLLVNGKLYKLVSGAIPIMKLA